MTCPGVKCEDTLAQWRGRGVALAPAKARPRHGGRPPSKKSGFRILAENSRNHLLGFTGISICEDEPP